MRLTAHQVLAGLFVLGLCFAAPSAAQEIDAPLPPRHQDSVFADQVSFTDEVDALHARIERLEAGAGDSSCNQCCDLGCRSPGVVVGGEWLYLKPYNSNGTGYAASSSMFPVDLGLNTGYDSTGRVWLGWQNDTGLGIRGRYFEFDHTYVRNIAVDTSVSHGWDTWLADVEVFDSTELGSYWDATVSAGYRHVEYQEQVAVSVPGPVVGDASSRFYGDGVTTGLELRRYVTPGTSLFANARASVLLGHERLAGTIDWGWGPGGVAYREDNDVKFIYEAQVGVQGTRELSWGGDLFLRAAFEVQHWSGFGLDVDRLIWFESNGTSDAGFAGFALALGIIR